MRALAGAVCATAELLLALRRRADDDQDALLLVFQAGLQMDAVGPDVDIALGRQVALGPSGVVVQPTVLQAADGGGRQAARILAEQGRERLAEIAGRDALEIQDRQQRLDRLRAPHVGGQDRRREADAARVVSRRFAVAHARLAHTDGADAGHHLALRKMAVPDNPLKAARRLDPGMAGEKSGNLDLDRLGKQGTRPVAQNFGELILKDPWLDQFDDVIVGHGISLLRCRSGGVKHPHDVPPSRFPPTPTFGHSSEAFAAKTLMISQVAPSSAICCKAGGDAGRCC
jgi:hypothetical protein